jgi:hypothetical protein
LELLLLVLSILWLQSLEQFGKLLIQSHSMPMAMITSTKLLGTQTKPLALLILELLCQIK